MTLSFSSIFPEFGSSLITTNGHGNSTQARLNGSTAAAMQPVAYEIAHQVNGRLRLRIPRLAYDEAFARRLAEAVLALPAVNQARVSPRSRSLVVHYEPGAFQPGGNGHTGSSPASILPELARAMQTAANGELEPDLPISKTDIGSQERINYFRRLGLPLLGLGLGAGVVAGLALPPLLVGATILISAVPIFKRTAQGIREEKRLPVDLLDSTAIVLLTVQSSFLAPAFVVVVIQGAEVLRDWTARRSKQAGLELLMSRERPIHVERNGRQEQLCLDDIQTDDIILVFPGDQVPVDGIVLSGRASLDLHRVTGEAVPLVCDAGDPVHASALVVEGHLRILARRTGYETQVGQVIAAMQAAPETDTRVSNYARKVGNWAVVPTLLTAGAVFTTSGSLARATGIVGLDLGTGMRVSAPVAILNAQAHAARRGILIRSGQALEALSQIDTIVFDKTATLTQGRARIVDIRSGPAGISAREVLTLAASAEKSLGHPIAESIVRFAHDRQLELRPCTAWKYHSGLGVEAQLGGQLLLVGNDRFMRQMGIDLVGLDGHSTGPYPAAASRVYVARDGELIGLIYCADPLRPESAAFIAHLQARQIRPLLVSGDSRPVTASVAAKVNIEPDCVFAEALPQQKVELVRSLQASGKKVAFVGDGVNDAAAMSQANVSISLGSATDLALESAGIVLMNDNLDDLMAAFELARHTMQLIRQNRMLVTGPNLGGIVYGALTVLSPVAGIALHNGSVLAATLNSLRPARVKQQTTGKEETI